MAICWRCLKPLMLRPKTQTCIYCGFTPDEYAEKLIQAKKAIHDLTGGDPKSYGSNKNYPIRKRLSMKD